MSAKLKGRENYELYDEIAYMLPQERCVVER
jgi:hypothetical protein